jgi:hypothetical protein
MEMSANKKWKMSGSTLSFKEWIDRENKKKEPEGNFIPFVPDTSSFNTSVSDTINQTLQEERDYIAKTAGYKSGNTLDKNTIFGLDKKVFIFSSLLVVGSLTYYFYSRLKKKK